MSSKFFTASFLPQTKMVADFVLRVQQQRLWIMVLMMVGIYHGHGGLYGGIYCVYYGGYYGDYYMVIMRLLWRLLGRLLYGY